VRYDRKGGCLDDGAAPRIEVVGHGATDVLELELPKQPSAHKYGVKTYLPSPWEFSEVTSCELSALEAGPGDGTLLY
jgi:hypothetical protein